MKYKRGKPREKKLVEWGTPKEYQMKKGNENSSPAKKPSWYCKKLKGKHDFIRTGAEPIKFLGGNTMFMYLKCRGCFKSKIQQKTKDEFQKEENKKVERELLSLQTDQETGKQSTHIQG